MPPFPCLVEFPHRPRKGDGVSGPVRSRVKWRPHLPLPLTSEDSRCIISLLLLSPHNSQAKVWVLPGGAARSSGHHQAISHSLSEGAPLISSQIQGLLPTYSLAFVLENPEYPGL